MKIFQKILNFIFPEKCSWCWKYWNFLCENCTEKILEREKKFFNLDSRLRGNDKDLRRDDDTLINKIFEKIYSPFFYKKNLVLKKILKEIKYKNKFSKFSGLEEKIFLELEKFLKSEKILNKNIFLIPTPLHWKKFLKRWFNQSEIFCDFLEKKWFWKKINLIKKIKNTKPQAQCKKEERLENLKWAFEIRKKYLEKILKEEENIFIIIDDIFSTWSTLKNCWIEIKKHFPNSKIYWFTICSDKF